MVQQPSVLSEQIDLSANCEESFTDNASIHSVLKADPNHFGLGSLWQKKRSKMRRMKSRFVQLEQMGILDPHVPYNEHSLKVGTKERVLHRILHSNAAHAALQVFWAMLLISVLGLLFHSLEFVNAQNRMELHKQDRDHVENLLGNFNLSHSDLETLSRYYSNAGSVEFNVGNPWSFENAAEFSVSFCTTIGYGFWIPQTLGGRLAIVLFALPSIGTFCYISSTLRILMREMTVHRLPPDTWTWYGLNLVLIISPLVASVLFYWGHEKTWDLFDSLYYIWVTSTGLGIAPKYPFESYSWMAALFVSFCHLLNLGNFFWLIEIIQLMVAQNYMADWIQTKKDITKLQMELMEDMEKSLKSDTLSDGIELVEDMKKTEKNR